MNLCEYLSEALVIGNGAALPCPALTGLLSLGVHSRWADADEDSGARRQLAQASRDAELSGAPGLLLLSADLPADAALGRHDDALIEGLENSAWDLLYLAHDEGQLDARSARRPLWVPCDSPPAGVRALGLSLPLLRRVLAQTLDLGPAASLRAGHWLGLLGWQASRLCRDGSALAKWPARIHAAHQTPRGAALGAR
ncbi:hypothetical protein [Roseateles oligotrophus]|uniref:Uncharacterized protein n=1 Tax=Roseateles oligotrophus TaxID=1769250 RepID=A0ABT2YFQ9_9BURK|nr:hypothetical protein [Roseateles oligotrophus]MCV2368888.1 hypothetical protein [Roseateles oligotrophus]